MILEDSFAFILTSGFAWQFVEELGLVYWPGATR